MTSAKNSRLLSQAGLATYLRVNKRTVRRWTRAGILPHFTDPDTGTIVYRRAEIERWESGTADRKDVAS